MCCDGLWQRALVRDVAERYDLVGVLLVDFPGPDPSDNWWKRRWRRYRSYLNPVTLVRHLVARRLTSRWEDQALPLVRELFYEDGRPPPEPLDVPVLRVRNVNEPAAVEFARALQPDVVCVNGTNLLRRPMLDLIDRIPLGIVNMHTGLSPYSRGGNCNLFMLLEGHPELVGVTIHHIDRGIDSGDLILTGRPELEPGDTFETIRAKVFRLGIDLMLEAIERLARGTAERVKQWTPGKLFLRRTGYRYSPWVRVRVNRRLRRGLLDEYLADRTRRDADVRLVGTSNPAER